MKLGHDIIHIMAQLNYTGESTMVLNSNSMPKKVDLLIYRGDFVELFATIFDDDNNPLDITGFNPEAAVLVEDGYVEFECSVTEPLLGKVRIYLPSSKSKDISPGTYEWDFQLENQDGDDRTYLGGKAIVRQDVTL